MQSIKLGRADLHMHTTVSDGLATVKEVLQHVAKRGVLDVIAITDHDRIEASLWAYENRHRYPFDIVPGVEVSSAGGHVLALWVTKPIPMNMSLKETIAAIHEQGGLAVLAHPFHVQMGFVMKNAPKYLRKPQLLLEWGLDAVEVHNAGMLTPGCNLVARSMAKRIGITQLGNSDAHTLGAIGAGWTRFPGHTAEHLRTAIETQQTLAYGRMWGAREYAKFTRDLIERRGQRCSDEEFDLGELLEPQARVEG
jgi:predicted metal-dependent phosphoesterase TrpH